MDDEALACGDGTECDSGRERRDALGQAHSVNSLFSQFFLWPPFFVSGPLCSTRILLAADTGCARLGDPVGDPVGDCIVYNPPTQTESSHLMPNSSSPRARNARPLLSQIFACPVDLRSHPKCRRRRLGPHSAHQLAECGWDAPAV